jgi:Domain of unknown function (DUF5615)
LIRFQADADLHRGIVLSARRREPSIDFTLATEVAIVGLADPQVLEIAAQQGRILVTHDRRTMPGHFRDRLTGGASSPGVFIVSQFEPVGSVVEVLLMVWAASDPADWHNQIRHLPSLALHRF